MIGYLVHLNQKWTGLQHVLIVAKDELDLLRQHAAGPWSKIGNNLSASRVTWVATTPMDWEEWDQAPLRHLCGECCRDAAAA